jgi:O-antigen/teichoic acid export membrane protein
VDARPVLQRTLGLIAVLAVPMVLLYAVAGEPLLQIVFGDDLTEAATALLAGQVQFSGNAMDHIVKAREEGKD